MEKIIENSQAQMRKGILEFCVMLVISKGKIYVSDIIKEMKKAELIVVEGTLYPLLNRLKNQELLGYEWEESKSGPPRKYYSLSKKGQSALEQLIKTQDKLNQSINSLKKRFLAK